MKTKIVASIIALTTAAIVAPAFAQAPAAASATASASTAISVDKTTVDEIIKNPKAKATLEAALPTITQYYDKIGGMTLTQIAPMSQGALDDAKLKALQVKFDEINAGK
jgi:hypothetical protein